MDYDLKRSNKAFYVYLFSSNNSCVKPTLPLMLPHIVCALVSPIHIKREGGGSLFALWMLIKIKYDIKARFHVATFMLWRVCAILKIFQSFDKITTLTYFLMDNFCPCFLNV